jgi:hypothetical protein
MNKLISISNQSLFIHPFFYKLQHFIISILVNFKRKNYEAIVHQEFDHLIH